MLVWTNARKDLVRKLRDPMAIVLPILLPIGLVILLIPLFGRAPRTDDRASLLIANADESEIARDLIALLEREPLSRWLDIEHVDEEVGRARVESSDADAVLVFPAGLGARLEAGMPARMELVADPRPLSSARIAERAADTLVLLTPRLLAGDEPERVARDLAAKNVAIDTRFGEWTEHGGSGVTQLCFPSLLFLALFLLANGLSDDLWRERLEGTLQRARATPGGVRAVVAGKLVAGAVLAFALAVLNVGSAAFLFGFDPIRALGATIWCALVGTTVLALFLLLQIHASTARTASILTNVVMIPVLMIGGGVFPFELLPAGLGTVGRYTPNGWALGELRGVLWGAVDGAGFASASAVVIAVLVALGLFLSRRVERAFGVPR